MSNSYVWFLQGLYDGILTDALHSFPSDRRELERDKSRLHSLVEARGISVFTLDLPAVGKQFDRCLSDGRLDLHGLPHSRSFKKGSPVPRLFKGLVMRVFDVNGLLRQDDADADAILFLRQLYYAAKKVRMTCDESKTFETVRDFFGIEQTSRSATHVWDADRLVNLDDGRPHFIDGLLDVKGQRPEPLLFQDLEPGAGQIGVGLLDTIQLTADIVSSSFGWCEPSAWTPKHGPGAVADLSMGKDSKYLFPHWPAKLEGVFPLSQFAFANYGSWLDSMQLESGWSDRFSLHEPPSRLIAVPKTQKGPRLIASEPTSHQWAQQAVKEFLEQAVRKSPLRNSISFRDQNFNREYAQRASKTGEAWTIDLSSASDRLSLWCVERALRANWSLLEVLHAVRTRWLVNDIDKKSPKYVKLRKLSPQGAAITFPIQTIVFATVCIGTLLWEKKVQPTSESIARFGRKVRVFGDDIIVPKEIGESVTQVLEYLGLKVNLSKTYGIGKFRESCGMDAYDGVDVTPAYVLEPSDTSRPESIASVVECSNNFHRKGFWHAAAWLKSTVDKWVSNNLPIVTMDSGLPGWVSFVGKNSSHLKTRWNESLHRYENLTFALRSTNDKGPQAGTASLLQFFTEDPSPDIIWASGVTRRPQIRKGLRWVPAPS
jgi:hypothetical protein